jgi:hypothetical protein
MTVFFVLMKTHHVTADDIRLLQMIYQEKTGHIYIPSFGELSVSDITRTEPTCGTLKTDCHTDRQPRYVYMIEPKSLCPR